MDNDSDDNNASQANDQEIEDVEDDSSASNDAGNSVSFDGDASDPSGGGTGD
ncbi:MAG: hypothetical protein ACRD47_16505 [Nitrososphaeraceae archaeon]